MKFDYTEKIYFSAVIGVFGIISILWLIVGLKDTAALAVCSIVGLIIATSIILSLPRKRA